MDSNIISLIPIISIINFCYLNYELKNKHINIDKSDKSENKYLNIIVIAISILFLSIFIEYNMGKIFLILVIILDILLIREKSVLQDKLFYFMGVTGIVSIYVIKNIYIKGLILLIISSIIIGYEILELKNKNKENKENMKSFLEGLLLTSLILVWGEYGKEPKLKYIKLFLRRN
jgi:hypothetical protein